MQLERVGVTGGKSRVAPCEGGFQIALSRARALGLQVAGRRRQHRGDRGDRIRSGRGAVAVGYLECVSVAHVRRSAAYPELEVVRIAATAVGALANVHGGNHVLICRGEQRYGHRQLDSCGDIEFQVVIGAGAVPIDLLEVLGVHDGRAVGAGKSYVLARQRRLTNGYRVGAVAVGVGQIPDIDNAVLVLVEDGEVEIGARRNLHGIGLCCSRTGIHGCVSLVAGLIVETHIQRSGCGYGDFHRSGNSGAGRGCIHGYRADGRGPRTAGRAHHALRPEVQRLGGGQSADNPHIGSVSAGGLELHLLARRHCRRECGARVPLHVIRGRHLHAIVVLDGAVRDNDAAAEGARRFQSRGRRESHRRGSEAKRLADTHCVGMRL